jgi:hypothetical protein
MLGYFFRVQHSRIKIHSTKNDHNMKLYKLFRQTVFFLTSILLFPSMVLAQSQWVDNGDADNYISIEIMKPVSAVDSMSGILSPNYTTLSGSIFLEGRYSIGKNIFLAADISIAHSEFDDENYASIGSHTVFGNPYIGAEYYLPETPLFFELGLRIPITPDR